MKHASLFTKIVTIGYISLMCLLTLGMFIYLGVCEDFVAPVKEEKPVQDLGLGGYKISEYSIEELMDYFIEKGFFTEQDIEEKKAMTVISSHNWIVAGVDMMKWDLDTMVEGSDEYNYWNEFNENEANDDLRYIMFGGTIYAPIFNDVFAIKATNSFTGDSEALYKSFEGFPSQYSKCHNHIEDFENLLLNNALIEDKTCFALENEIASANRIYSGIEFLWFDDTDTEKADNLTTLKNNNGKITYNEKDYTFVVNGSYAIRVTDDYKGDKDKLISTFTAWDLFHVDLVS